MNAKLREYPPRKTHTKKENKPRNLGSQSYLLKEYIYTLKICTLLRIKSNLPWANFTYFLEKKLRMHDVLFAL